MITKPTQLQLATLIATIAHGDQTRRGGKGYIDHPTDVASFFRDPTLRAVAMLHDTIENTKVNHKSLLELGVDNEIANAVLAMTKPNEENYEEYLDMVAENSLSIKVKIADMLSNLGDLPTEKQVRNYAKGLTFLLTKLGVFSAEEKTSNDD